MDLTARLRDVFAEALELGSDVDVREVRFREHPSWDSLGHMALVVAIEDGFDVELTAEQLISMDSFDAALEMLREAGVDGRNAAAPATAP